MILDALTMHWTSLLDLWEWQYRCHGAAQRRTALSKEHSNLETFFWLNCTWDKTENIMNLERNGWKNPGRQDELIQLNPQQNIRPGTWDTERFFVSSARIHILARDWEQIKVVAVLSPWHGLNMILLLSMAHQNQIDWSHLPTMF